MSDKTVGKLLHGLGYSLQAAKKTVEGAPHPDRNAQFAHVSAQAAECFRRGVPYISVDTKKKELIGNFKNAGVEWHPKDQPELVDVHNFPSDAIGKAIPYGVYDVAGNTGFVNVGTDHDTPVFAVTSIEEWWMRMGRKRYPDASEIFITADAGGSNGYRARVWKFELQRISDKFGLPIHVSQLPAWLEQVAQDRASALLVHHNELARKTTPHLRDNRKPHWKHHEQRQASRHRLARPS